MNLLIAAQKAILGNPQSTPQQKERALAALKEIPAKDPRYTDAQSVLSELGLVKLEAVGKLEDKPAGEKRKPAAGMNNAMFWSSMSEMQAAMDHYHGAVEAEGERLSKIMSEWAATKDETLLNSFTEAAAGFVEKSLEILGLSWEQVKLQLQIWARMREASGHEEYAKGLYELADAEPIPVFQASVLLNEIWPTIRGTLGSWNEESDRAGVSRASFAGMDVSSRCRAAYKKTGNWPGKPEARL